MSEGSLPSGCPCGRSHPPTGLRLRKLRKPRDTASLTTALYEQGQTIADADASGRLTLHYSGNCQAPIEMKVNDTTRIFAVQKIRCRKCKACLEARKYHWGRRGSVETARTAEAGLRTWFGTLTLSPEADADISQRALERMMQSMSGSAVPDWWTHRESVTYFCRKREKWVTVQAYVCDERFRLVCAEVLAEVQRYWKRLRKAGHRFSYLVVFERHKTGLPHAHFLLHEKEAVITKRALQAQWPFGHTNVSIVGGKSARVAASEKAAWYVVKYLSKSYQSRQKASLRYGKP